MGGHAANCPLARASLAQLGRAGPSCESGSTAATVLNMRPIWDASTGMGPGVAAGMSEPPPGMHLMSCCRALELSSAPAGGDWKENQPVVWRMRRLPPLQVAPSLAPPESCAQWLQASNATQMCHAQPGDAPQWAGAFEHANPGVAGGACDARMCLVESGQPSQQSNAYTMPSMHCAGPRTSHQFAPIPLLSAPSPAAAAGPPMMPPTGGSIQHANIAAASHPSGAQLVAAPRQPGMAQHQYLPPHQIHYKPGLPLH